MQPRAPRAAAAPDYGSAAWDAWFAGALKTRRPQRVPGRPAAVRAARHSRHSRRQSCRPRSLRHGCDAGLDSSFAQAAPLLPRLFTPGKQADEAVLDPVTMRWAAKHLDTATCAVMPRAFDTTPCHEHGLHTLTLSHHARNTATAATLQECVRSVRSLLLPLTPSDFRPPRYAPTVATAVAEVDEDAAMLKAVDDALADSPSAAPAAFAPPLAATETPLAATMPSAAASPDIMRYNRLRIPVPTAHCVLHRSQTRTAVVLTECVPSQD